MAGIPGGSIDPYKIEIFMQCYAATFSWNHAHEKLMTVPPPGAGQQMSHALRAIGDLQAFLVSAGVLSDLFFPDPKKGDVARGQNLRIMYGVKPDSPLANKKVRNSFVHVDERLDKWLPSQAGKAVGPFAIVNGSGPGPASVQPSHLRIVDTRDWKITVRGESLDLLPLLQEIDRIGRAFPLVVTGSDGLPVTIAFSPARFV